MSTAASPFSAELMEGALGSELGRRIARATAEAQRLLDVAPEPAGHERLRELATGLSTLLEPAAGERLIAEHDEALRRLRERFEHRFAALARARAAADQLRKITSPAAILARAPAALCGGSNFSRAILSLVGGGRMVPEAAHFDGSKAEAASRARTTPGGPDRA